MLLYNAEICTKYYIAFRIKFTVPWIKNVVMIDKIWEIGCRVKVKRKRSN